MRLSVLFLSTAGLNKQLTKRKALNPPLAAYQKEGVESATSSSPFPDNLQFLLLLPFLLFLPAQSAARLQLPQRAIRHWSQAAIYLKHQVKKFSPLFIILSVLR